MGRVMAAITLAATLAASSASAFDPEDLKRLIETNECVGCDLSNADLLGVNLKKAILVLQALDGCSLQQVMH